MSSFRPDVEAVAVDFVPTPLAPLAWALTAAAAGPADATSGEAASQSEAPRGPTPEELAALEQAAFDRGVESARREQEALAATCETLERAIEAWRAAAATEVTANRTLVLDLCRELVRHWVQAELAVSADTYAAYLDRALAEMRDEAGVRLRLATADLSRLEMQAPEAVAQWRAKGIDLDADGALTEGSFVLETARAAVDGRLEAIADRLREALAPAIAAPLPGADSAAPEAPAARSESESQDLRDGEGTE